MNLTQEGTHYTAKLKNSSYDAYFAAYCKKFKGWPKPHLTLSGCFMGFCKNFEKTRVDHNWFPFLCYLFDGRLKARLILDTDSWLGVMHEVRYHWGGYMERLETQAKKENLKELKVFSAPSWYNYQHFFSVVVVFDDKGQGAVIFRVHCVYFDWGEKKIHDVVDFPFSLQDAHDLTRFIKENIMAYRLEEGLEGVRHLYGPDFD